MMKHLGQSHEPAHVDMNMDTNVDERTLYRRGSVYSSADPYATAMLVEGATVVWVGSEEAADNLVAPNTRVVDLAGAVITPGFVDSHVHLSDTGQALTSLDLSAVRSQDELLARLQDFAQQAPPGIVTGHGWDESQWGHAALPSAGQLEAASGGREVLLSRVDGHSALASQRLLERLALTFHPDNADGWLRLEARRRAVAALAEEASGRREEYQRAALEHAASLGFVAVVENAAPQIQPIEDVRTLLGLEGTLYQSAPALPEVQALWGQAVSDAEEAEKLLASFDGRLLGLGGDLNADGSLGSHTAYLRAPYTDEPGLSGAQMLSVEQIEAHLRALAAVRAMAGFHVIGDGASENIIRALEKIRYTSPQLLRTLSVRLEHLEMPDANQIERLSSFAVHASVQPSFDALWGGPGGMYERRVGERARGMNPFASMLRAGIPLIFGSDSPVTGQNGWESVRAAVQAHLPEERLAARAAFRAATQVPWRFSVSENIRGAQYRGLHTGELMGTLQAGAPASFAIWEVEELAIEVPDSRVAAWSTDPRAGTPMLPSLSAGQTPVCLKTVHHGRVLFESAEL